MNRAKARRRFHPPAGWVWPVGRPRIRWGDRFIANRPAEARGGGSNDPACPLLRAAAHRGLEHRMRKWTTSLFALGLGLFVAGTTLPAAAQNQPAQPGQDNNNNNNNNNNNGGRRNRGGGGNFDPAQ